jgi:hypothetical protein
VRGRILAYAKRLGAEHGFGDRSTTPLPVCAGDVDRGEPSMWRAKRREKCLGALEPELGATPRAREQVVKRGTVRCQGTVHPDAAGRPDI